MDLEIIAAKGETTFLKTPELELDNQLQFSVIYRTFVAEMQSAYFKAPADGAISQSKKELKFLHRKNLA